MPQFLSIISFLKKVFFPQGRKNKVRLNASGKLIFLSILIGIIGGLGAALFYSGLSWTENLVLNNIAGFREGHGQSDLGGKIPLYFFFLVPALGGLIAGFITYTWAPETAGQGTDSMIASFHRTKGQIRTRVPFLKALTSIITIGSGGSAGYEGPTAQIGSGLGSIVAQLFKVPEKMSKLLLLAGTAAGLGAIFRAPLGGALSAVEMIYKEDFESDGFLPCILASVVAFAIFSLIHPDAGAIFSIPAIPRPGMVELVFFAGLGIACAPLSRLFVAIFFTMARKFGRLNIPRPLKPALGGLGVGLLSFLCPQIVGGGWWALEDAMNGHFTWTILVSILLFKMLATSLTVGSGGSGGLFGPSLFIGGFIGAAYGFGMELLFPQYISHPQAYVLVGMGAFFAGVAKAPIASMLMVCEVTGHYNLLAPLMISSVLHVFLSQNWGIYKNQKLNKFESPVHRDEMNTDILESVTVQSILPRGQKPVSIQVNQTLGEIAYLLQETSHDVFPVLSEDNKLIGLVGLNDLRKCILQKEAANLVIVEDLMSPTHALTLDMDLHEAALSFLRSGHAELPVQDDQGNLVGLLRLRALAHTYDQLTGSFKKKI